MNLWRGVEAMGTATYRVEGMHCLDCARKVEQALREVAGVQSARVHYLKRQAVVVADDGVSLATLEEAVRRAGYALRRGE